MRVKRNGGESVGERVEIGCASVRIRVHPPIIPIRDGVVAKGGGTPNDWTRLSPSARSQNRSVGEERNDSCLGHIIRAIRTKSRFCRVTRHESFEINN